MSSFFECLHARCRDSNLEFLFSNFKAQWPLHNVPLKVCWKYGMQSSFIINLSKFTRPFSNLYVHGMRPNLSLVHGMWMRLIEVAHSVISINWPHLSENHTLGLRPIVFYKDIADYCKKTFATKDHVLRRCYAPVCRVQLLYS